MGASFVASCVPFISHRGTEPKADYLLTSLGWRTLMPPNSSCKDVNDAKGQLMASHNVSL